MILRSEFSYKAHGGGHDIFGCIWRKEGRYRYKGVVQLAHGMEEHILRYQHFAIFLASQGFIVCGNDHMGHGRSVSRREDLGFFGEKIGSYENLILDMHYLMEIIKKRFPSMPYFLIGHSMGSFLAREFAARYHNQLTGMICMGTSGGNPFLDVGILLTEIGVRDKGARKKAYNVNMLAFGSFNRRFEPRRTEYDWLSSDPRAVNSFIRDRKCGFVFPYSGYRELFLLLKEVSAKQWAKRIEVKLPMLFLSGMNDPVGEYGKGPERVVAWLREAGCENVGLRLYKYGRHELLNETFRQQVYRVILSWLHEVMLD